MALYALLSTLTDEGRRTVKTNPVRVREVNREVEEMGAKVVTQYAALGGFDFLTIVEAPDNLTVANISVQLGSRGTIQIQTIPLIEVDDLIGRLKAK
ncbi:MAG: GYD domain-containing protein [Gemmatimonadota bacterium]